MASASTNPSAVAPPLTTTTTAAGSRDQNDSSNSFFSQSSVPCLTHPEECLLKTALAMVVIRKRSRHRHHTSLEKDEEEKEDISPPFKKTLLERIFQDPSNAPAMLLQLPHPKHMDRIFQAARTMALHSSSSSSSSANQKALKGTTCHLAHQLQVWILSSSNGNSSTTASSPPDSGTSITASKKDEDDIDMNSTNDVELWICNSLLTVPAETTFLVYSSLLQENSFWELKSLIFKILTHLIHQAYHDKLVVVSSSELNAMVVAWLRLTQQCLLTCTVTTASREEMQNNLLLLIPILQDTFGDLLVPLVPAAATTTTTTTPTNSIGSSATTTTTTANNISFVKTFWNLSCNSMSQTPSNNGSYLNPGSKMILRLGLYRLLHLVQA
eukprot:scaffold618_cov130-Cylindrotheca_fusiformis.AAC.36